MYLDWIEVDKDYFVLDIETDSLSPTVIHCLCWMNLKTGETGDCTTIPSIKDFFERTKGSVYVGHNALKFDGPVLARLAEAPLSVSNLVDTLVLSTLYSPSIDGGHSLSAWGQRLGNEKDEHSDWSRFSPEMLSYCRQDVQVTAELFRRLTKTLSRIEFSEKSIWIEHRFVSLLDRQTKNGVHFNIEKAIELYSRISSREETLQDEIRRAFPPERVLVATRQMYTKSGDYTSIYLKDKDRFIIDAGDDGVYRAYEDVDFSIGSPKQRVQKLLELGWEPEEFTPRTRRGGGGNPKPFDKGKLAPSLERFLEEHDIPEVEMIARWMSLKGRTNMLNNWIEAFNHDTHCIHGDIWTADTLRRRHEKPNTANIPAVRLDKEGNILYNEDGYYTYEARDCWEARPKRVLVGTDAKSLEYRMLGHHVNNPELTNVILTSDVHVNTQKLAELDTKAKGKTLNFALIYGGQDPKIGSIVGGTRADGARLRALI
jgi:DNA polymerase-1